MLIAHKYYFTTYDYFCKWTFDFDVIHVAEEKNTVTSTMTFEAGVTTSTFEIIKYELKEAFTETLTLLLPEFKFDASEVGLKFKEDQVVLITFRVDDTEGVLKTIKDDSFMEKLKEKMNDYEILQEVVLKSVSAGTYLIRLIYYGKIIE